MRVGIFYNSISNPAKFSNKVMLMDNFALGARSQGDEVIEFRDNRLPDQKLDAGFVLGYTLEDNFRKKSLISCAYKKLPVCLWTAIFCTIPDLSMNGIATVWDQCIPTQAHTFLISQTPPNGIDILPGTMPL
jgi:hypothetical protein